MVRGPKDLAELARQFVCVRVTDMTDVDLGTFDFDYDLTFAALLMAADGRIYHTFAGRDAKSPTSHASLKALMAAMRSTLNAHNRIDLVPKRYRPPRKVRPRRTPRQIAKQAGVKPKDCIHCHQIFEYEYEVLKRRKRFTSDELWRWPTPARIGLTLDRNDQARVTSSAGAAAKAGLRAGDRLRFMNDQAVITYGDVQRALHELPRSARALKVEYSRDGKERTAMLALSSKWREQPLEEFAWRSKKWPLSPKPGFGGRPLGKADKKRLGLPEDRWAFRVGYIVNWGRNAHTGRNAARAGIRKGDIVYEIDGESDFASMHHYHAWFRLTRKIGRKATVKLIRKGERRTVQLPVIE